MDFVKKEWQFRDIISENELNRMEDGIEEGITKAEQAEQVAEQAQQIAEFHASRHAAGGPDEITPEMIGAETPAGAQAKVDAHASATTGVHGATSGATPNTIVQRDENGQFRVQPPTESWHVARKAEVDAKLSLSGGTMSGRIRTANATGAIDQSGSSNAVLEVLAAEGAENAAFITFHRPNRHAVHFGLDIDNELKYGGWSLAGQSYKLWTERNFPYETGNWTPELRFGGSTAGITYAFRAGRYTRIANVVYWSFAILLNSKGSASGVAEIVGLPFSASMDLSFPHAVGRAVNISVPSGQWLLSYVSGTTVRLNTNTDSVILSTAFSNDSTIGASGFYFIS